VDDHALLRDGLHTLLDAQPDFEVVGSCADGEEVLERMAVLRPDLVVMDLLMPGMGGREAAFRILADHGPCRVVIVSSVVDADEVQKLLEMGVSGFVAKTAPAPELLRSLHAACQGEVALSSEVTTALAHAMRAPRAASPPPLTPRQLDVLLRLSRGLTTREVAEELCLSSKTVEKHRAEILRSLEAKNLVGALRRARELNLIPLE
jgi:DNA-binding NarL/FixJ family response regulator